MIEHLKFQLYGPFQAWGDIAIGENRQVYERPSKSGIVGLIAAALGIDRSEETELKTLSDSFGLAIRVDNIGISIKDFHTTQVAPGASNRNLSSRKNELLGFDLKTILSTREYRCDSFYGVVIWKRESNASNYSLLKLKEALERPKFALYLGRKSCVPAMPLFPQIVKTGSLAEALALASPREDKLLRPLFKESRPHILAYWEECPQLGEIQSIGRLTRRDDFLNRSRWQFGDRFEFYGTLKGKSGEEKKINVHQ